MANFMVQPDRHGFFEPRLFFHPQLFSGKRAVTGAVEKYNPTSAATFLKTNYESGDKYIDRPSQNSLTVLFLDN